MIVDVFKNSLLSDNTTLENRVAIIGGKCMQMSLATWPRLSGAFSALITCDYTCICKGFYVTVDGLPYLKITK